MNPRPAKVDVPVEQALRKTSKRSQTDDDVVITHATPAKRAAIDLSADHMEMEIDVALTLTMMQSFAK